MLHFIAGEEILYIYTVVFLQQLYKNNIKSIDKGAKVCYNMLGIPLIRNFNKGCTHRPLGGGQGVWVCWDKTPHNFLANFLKFRHYAKIRQRID